MKTLLASLIVASSLAVAVPALPIACQSIHQVALSTKQITVFANNAASALAKAQADNPGWIALSVKKVNDNPKSRAYRVSMKKITPASNRMCFPTDTHSLKVVHCCYL